MQFLVLTFALTAIALALIGWLSIRIGDAIASFYGRAVIAAVVSACFLAGPAVATLWFTALVRTWYRVWFIDLPILILLSPVMLATLAAYLAMRTGIQHDAWRSAALVTYACSALFGVLNIVNFCSPGWCGRYGFPFAYYEWSDSVMIFDGVWPDPYHPEALPLNAGVFLGVLAMLLLIVRVTHQPSRPASQRVAPPGVDSAELP